MKNFYLAVFGLFSIGAFAQNNTFPTPTGNVGIGTSFPSYPLEILYKSSSTPSGIYDHARVGTYISSLGLPPIVWKDFGLYISENSSGYLLRTKTSERTPGTQSFISILDHDNTIADAAAISLGYGTTSFLSVIKNGKVRISSSNISVPAGYRLYVEDGILTEKVKVAIEGTADWADYVFAEDYELMPLEEVEAFTKENKHLPNVPCAEDMVTEGLDVAQMDAKLLEKIEELTLYLIEQNKHIEALKAEVEALKKDKQ